MLVAEGLVNLKEIYHDRTTPEAGLLMSFARKYCFPEKQLQSDPTISQNTVPSCRKVIK